MEKVGVLVVSYGSRGAALVDTFTRSNNYDVEVYVVDRHKNPLNVKNACKHVVIPDLHVEKICKFAEDHRDKLSFGIVGPEAPIIHGVRDVIETRTSIPMICPTKEYAIERSKVVQRRLFQKIVPEVNPRFKVFNPNVYATTADVKVAVWKWLDELEDQAVVKPDGVTAGKGVGVWGDHFTTREQLFEHFLSNYVYGPVIIEEKIVGEESSFQAFCDGKHLVPLPETRDYKRAFDGDTGPNTGGMGSFKATTNWLPFTGRDVWEREIQVAEQIFNELKGQGYNPNLRGVPFYLAFMHTGNGMKLLECNSRPGDPEIQNLLPILKDDFVDVCYRMIDGTLRGVTFKPQATVVTYKVPPTYGGKVNVFAGDRKVDLSKAYRISSDYGGRMKVYPGAIEQRNDETYALTSRSVCVVGVGDTIADAREISLTGIDSIQGGSLWSRRDIASTEHVMKCINHMKTLRG
jgi:phosphoribosylamine--glycine ligase